MANICYYKIKVKGSRKSCYKLIDMMPVYSGEIVIIDELGSDKDYSLIFEGSCKNEIDAYTKKHKNISSLSKDKINNIKDGDYLDYPLSEKSLLLKVEILCNTLSEDGFNKYFHYNKGNSIKDKCPDELEISFDSLEYDIDNQSNSQYTIVEYKEDNECVLYSFNNKNAIEMIIPDNVTYINEGFGCCLDNLIKVIIPKSVKVIDFDCLAENNNLETVLIYGNPEILEGCFIDCPRLVIKGNSDSNNVIDYCNKFNIKFSKLESESEK